MEAHPAPDSLNGRAQASIRSFFQPRQPNYTPPPSTSTANSNSNSTTPPPKKTAIASLPSSSTQSVNPAPAIIRGASIAPVAPHHVQPLRRINSLLLPIAYPDSFYHKILQPNTPSSANFSRIILWTDSPTISTPSPEPKVIGGVVCRLDAALAADSTPQALKYVDGTYDIYVQSLALLSPYRGKGLATQVLDSVVKAAVQEASRENGARIQGLYAHVWTDNADALKWYAARGFRKEEPAIGGYYRRLKPDTAWILRRRLNPSDHLNNAASPILQPAQTTAASSPAASEPIIAPPSSVLARPTLAPHARSFQDKGPDREWNDLPEDVLGNGLLKPQSHLASAVGSAASSRSSSRNGTERGKKKRVYPAAAFGS